MLKLRIRYLCIILAALMQPIVASAQSQLPCGDQSHTITFDEYPVGTTIYAQYSAYGVVFGSNGADFPFTTMDGVNPTSPVLSGNPTFEGPITVVFVSPYSTGTRAATKQLSFEAGEFDALNSTAITYIDINHNVISTQTNPALGIYTITAPPGTSSFTIGSTTDPAGFAIDNLSYTLDVESPLMIASPLRDDMYALTQNNLTQTANINFKASGTAAVGTVSWNVAIEYDTDTPRGLQGLVNQFTTIGTASAPLTYQSRGGRVTVTASAGTSSPSQSCPLQYFYVVGTTIPKTQITNQLLSLYSHGATPRLMTGIAMKESSYQQFISKTKYSKTALWPYESLADGGSHVGLMQVGTAPPNTTVVQGELNAWDWVQNTVFAVNLFQQKLSSARNLESSIRKQYKGLRALTGTELENMALTLYGDHPSGQLNMQYYWVSQLADGSYAWIVNTANNPLGVAYAQDVVSQIQ